jgi:hypothetical protein
LRQEGVSTYLTLDAPLGFEYFKWITHHISARVLLSLGSHGKRFAHARHPPADELCALVPVLPSKVMNYSREIHVNRVHTWV